MAQAVVGLGNPEPKYRGTRHNIGHLVLDRVAESLGAEQILLTGFRSMPRVGRVAEGTYGTDSFFLLKPAGYMNESGRAVLRFVRMFERYRLGPADLILVYDDIDLPLGKVRVRLKGSHGGHRGVESIIESLGTLDLRRVKVGIGRPPGKDEVVDHVLSRFAPDELPMIEGACAEAARQVLKLVESGLAQRA